MTEEWRILIRFPSYEISNYGRIRRVKKASGTRIGRLLGHRITKKGYWNVVLSINGKSYTQRLHRLVLEAFVGPCPEGMEARHLDDNKNNNKLSNLEWGTHQDNMNDRTNNGKTNFGHRNPFCRITDEEVIDILNDSSNIKDIAKRYNVAVNTIRRFKNGTARKYLTNQKLQQYRNL